MKHIVESVEEMYHARQPTGEVIVDEVINILRHYKLIYPEDVALLMDVKVRDLRSAWFMLTGTRLVDVITHWRLLQAQDWLRKRIDEMGDKHWEKREMVKLLKETARRCGWKSEVVMSHVFKRYCGCTALDWVVQEQKTLEASSG
jgi:AraC-like DNA-binding protein